MDVAPEDVVLATDLHALRAARVNVVVIDHSYTFPPLLLRIADRGRDPANEMEDQVFVIGDQLT